jgi:hypothetical protein
MDFGNN